MRPAPGDLIAACRRSLTEWRAPGEQQRRLRQDFVDFIDEHPADGWSRSCRAAHLTASSLISSADADRVLLTLHRRLGRWLQTGGHLEAADASPEAAALREAREESGLDQITQHGDLLLLSQHRVPCGPAEVCYHLDLQFLHVADPRAEITRSEESTDLRWFDADALPETDDSVRALVAAARARLG